MFQHGLVSLVPPSNAYSDALFANAAHTARVGKFEGHLCPVELMHGNVKDLAEFCLLSFRSVVPVAEGRPSRRRSSWSVVPVAECRGLGRVSRLRCWKLAGARDTPISL